MAEHMLKCIKSCSKKESKELNHTRLWEIREPCRSKKTRSKSNKINEWVVGVQGMHRKMTNTILLA